MRLLLLFVVVMLGGCPVKPAEVGQPENNSKIQVAVMFTFEGCSVYRFKDGMHTVYYSNCSKATMCADESCGENCTQRVCR